MHMHIKYIYLYIFVNIFLKDHAHTKLSSFMMASEQFLFQRAGAGGKRGCLSTSVANGAILTPAFLPLLHIPLISD